MGRRVPGIVEAHALVDADASAVSSLMLSNHSCSVVVCRFHGALDSSHLILAMVGLVVALGRGIETTY